MNQFPFFSIVIPTYNRAAFIGTTLESVFRQTYSNYEVIVVDNCSTDDTEQVLAPHIAHGRIHFIRHEQNYERARSRNTGMSAARGDFVTLLDSDDLMYPTNLEDAANFALANPAARCFHNLFELVDEEGKVVYQPRFPSIENHLKAIAQTNFMSCIGDFIHREIYTKYRFSIEPLMIGGEDWEFWLRVLADHKVERIEKVNSGVVHHRNRSVNTQNIESMKRGLEYMVQNIRQDPHLFAVYRPYMKYIESSSMMYLATLSNAADSQRQALRFLWQALKTNPAVATSPRFIRTSQLAAIGLVRRRTEKQNDN
jgi:glycosyltransferase involved in cell wall biosynthesis